MLKHSRKTGSRRDAPSLPACKSPTHSSLNPECGILRSPLHAQPEPRCRGGTLRGWRLPRAAASAVTASERAGRLPRVWKLKWSREPGGVQFNANISRCRQGVGIAPPQCRGPQLLTTTSEALWGPAALRDTAERHRPPAPEGQAHAAL